MLFRSVFKNPEQFGTLPAPSAAVPALEGATATADAPATVNATAAPATSTATNWEGLLGGNPFEAANVEVQDTATVVGNAPVTETVTVAESAPVTEKKPKNGWALAGFLCSLFIAPYIFGLIFSIVGLKKANEFEQPRKGLAVTGLVISSLILVSGMLLPVLMNVIIPMLM